MEVSPEGNISAASGSEQAQAGESNNNNNNNGGKLTIERVSLSRLRIIYQ